MRLHTARFLSSWAYLLAFLVFSTFGFGQPPSQSLLDSWMFFEQKRMAPTVDPKKIVSIDDLNKLDPVYRPESARFFPLSSVWVPSSEWSAIEAPSLLDPSVRADLIKLDEGQTYYRLFVHPLSKSLYAPQIEKYGLQTEHLATPTSSVRSLLIQGTDKRIPFFAKVSLDVRLGGSHRTLPEEEVIRSVGVSQYISQQKTLDPGFEILPDALGIIPKDSKRAGQLIRPIPKSVLLGQSLPIPFFSIYSRTDNEHSLIEEWAKKTGLSAEKFTEEYLLKPYAKAWTQWALSGLTHEAHAQNVLIETDPVTGLPSGKFFLRDMGGLFLNPKAHSVSPNHLSQLPAPNGFFWDYQKYGDSAETSSLDSYFVGGVLYNLDKELDAIDPDYRKGSLEHLFYQFIRNEITSQTGLPSSSFRQWDLRHQMGEVLRWAREKKTGSSTPTLSQKLEKPFRLGFYSGTFDPPHLGHLNLIQAAIEEGDLDMVIIAPNFTPPYKPQASAYSHRKKMAALLFNQPKMTLVWDDFELASKRSGADGVLRRMLKHYDPDTEIYRILGDDSFDWFLKSEEGLTHPRVTYFVSQRDPHKQLSFPNQIRKSPVKVMNHIGAGLSSSSIKTRLEEIQAPPELPKNIHTYIQTHGIYPCHSSLKRLANLPN